MTEVTAEPSEAAAHDGPGPEHPPPSPEAPREAVTGLDDPASGSVKGRIKVADEVVEKVAALAALEVPGVADMGGDFERAIESVRDRIGLGSKRGNQGVRAEITDGLVAIDVTLVVEYGHVVMEVAGQVQGNVAVVVARMLGLEVVEVNVTVDDVRLPGEAPAED